MSFDVPQVSDNGSDEEWKIPGPHRKRKVALVAVVCVILVSGFYLGVPKLESLFSKGPTPVWHTFQGVFESGNSVPVFVSGGACSLQGTLSVVGIPTLTIEPTTTAICSYNAETYIGYVDTDCNLQATGIILSINGTLVPYMGCRLSYAPLQLVFPDLYTLTHKANDSVPVYKDLNVIANISLASNLKAEGCSYHQATVPKTNGFFTCKYLGITYAESNMVQNCNLGTPIQVNGVAVPLDSCVADRSDSA